MPEFRAWLTAYSDNGAVENLTFGNRLGNTFGVDSLQPGEYKELEPPPPSPGFDCIWVLPPGRTGQWGSYRGLLRRDWRDTDSAFYSTRQDTWAVRFAQNDNSGATISFKWADCLHLSSGCDSMFIVDPSGRMGWPDNRLDMFMTDTITVVSAGDSGIFRFHIIKYGHYTCWDCGGTSRCLASTEEPVPEIPHSSSLAQNYPNPFNPSTTLVVNLPRREYVVITVYNMLGREEESVFSGTVGPGRHEFTWNALGKASGVYAVRLTTLSSISTQLVVLAK